VTAVLLVPDTAAKNWLVLSVPVEGGTSANGGEIATVIGPVGPAIATIAVPFFEASARLVAINVTGFASGTEAGARKSTFPEIGPAGGAHGFDPIRQTCPTIPFPFVVPFTAQVTAASEVVITFAVNVMRWLTGTVAAPGETLTATLLVTVTIAEAVCVPPDDTLAVA